MPGLDEKSMSADFIDDQGQPKVIYSTSGEPRTAAQFNQAYELSKGKSGTAPKGYVILDPETFTEKNRSLFEQVSQPVQRFLKRQAVDYANYSAPQALPMILEKLGVVKPGTTQSYKAQAMAEGEETGNALAGMISTPGRAAATGAGALASLLAPGPVTKLAQIPGRMIAAGTAAGAASTGARALTGEGFPATDIAVDAGLQALGAGAQGVMNYFTGKFFTPDKGKQVYDEMVGALKAKYPNFANDPDLINMATKASPEQIRQITQIGTRALTGSTEKLADDLTLGVKQSFNAYAPRGMSQGEQVSLRGKAKALVAAGRDLLENIDDTAKVDAAKQSMTDASNAIDTFVTDLVKKTNMKGDPKLMYNEVYRAVQASIDRIHQAEQGAKVLSAFKEAGAERGFDPIKFNNIIVGKYMKEPGSLLERMGDILGQGQPLRPSGQPGTFADRESSGFRAMRELMLPGFANKLIDFAGRRIPTAPPPVLPWQAPAQLPAPVANTIQQGPNAIRGFIHRDED